METIIIQADSSRELTMKILLFIDHCKKRGMTPTTISNYADSSYLYAVKIGTKGAEYESISI